MRVRIGNQTSLLASPVLLPFEYAVSRGFDAFEWFPDKKESGEGWTEDDLAADTRVHIRETASANDISLSVHAALPSHPGEGGAISKCMELARDIGARLINIHFSPDEGTEAYAASVIKLLERLSKAGIALSIENTPETTPQDINALFAYRALGGFPVGMCLDLGHANLCPETRNDYLGYVDLLDPTVPIIHIHMHENYGDYDSHLPVFTGPAGSDPSGIKALIDRLKKRNFFGSIILEQWPHPPDLLDNARNRLLDMMRDMPVSPKGGTGALRASFEDGRKRSLSDTGDDDFAEAVVEANKRFLSWRKRLEWVGEIVSGMRRPDLGKLVDIAIYLHFIGTGQVPCGEDGGHYRPSNHARIAQRIYGRLAAMGTAENIFIIRKIYPWLPSFDTPFMRSEPLTRIRDIAHRNDIPQELKREIKVTLQNKLHRSAGPEDLKTSESLLKRITAPGASYSPGFVKEFRTFHEELKEFFGANSLDEQLDAFMRRDDSEQKDLIGDFLKSKKGARTGRKMLEVLERLTALRGMLGKRLSENGGAEGHRIQLIDIALEDYCFVLLSRLVNYFDDLGENPPWIPALHCLSLAVANLRFSGFDHEECGALESELAAWTESFNRGDRDHLLRIKATVDRCRRLADDYCTKILTLFPGRVERLGRALGVQDRAIDVYAEADVRSHPVFQLSRLVKVVSRVIKPLAGLSPWEVIFPGRAHGLVVCAPDMSSLPGPLREPVIAVLDRIEGDETISSGITGIIVGHETPFLSHFAVRTRQRNVVFAACDDKAVLEEMKGFCGQEVVLDASSGEVRLEISHDRVKGGHDILESKIRHSCDVASIPSEKLLPLEEVTPETGGPKAFGVKRLIEISAQRGSGFTVPEGIVIPFGIMEEILSASPAAEKGYRLLTGELDNLGEEGRPGALAKLKEIILDIEVPHDIVSTVIKKFGNEERLMVRSSSNCEDGRGSSGAGVYASMANVAPRQVSQAIRTVWASLWNAGAFAERKTSGVLHNEARMAVLIQRMVPPEYSFIMHTVNPALNDPSEILVECAVGLGDVLASGDIPGAPYRTVFYKDTGKVRMISFASFSKSVQPDGKIGTAKKTIDYSLVDFSTNKTFRNHIGSHIGAVGMLVEREMGGPQDIEGLIAKKMVYLVQSRPQQGL